MKFLCISDQVDPLVYSQGARERFRDVDFVLSAGDLPDEYLGFVVSMLNKPLYFVRGNHDGGTIRRRQPLASAQDTGADDSGEYGRGTGAIDAGFRARKESGVLILGFPGSMRYNRRENQYSDFDMWMAVLAAVPKLFFNKLFHGRAADIILTHAPPFGVQDRKDLCHRGFTAYLWLMRVFKPAYLVHGHIHLYGLDEARMCRYGQTTVVNAFSHCVLELPPQGEPAHA